MTAGAFPDHAPARAPWLITLADLALLLVGFFVFLQASRHVDRDALARGIRHGFGAPALAAAVAPMPVAAAAVRDFAAGSAVLPGAPGSWMAWARDAARDPRVTITLTGAVDGSAKDVDPLTGSGTLLAVDRARAVGKALAEARAVPLDRLRIVTAPAHGGGARGVVITLGYGGAGR